MLERWLYAAFWFKFDGRGRINLVDFISIEIEVKIMSMGMKRTGWSWNKISKMTIQGVFKETYSFDIITVAL
jgi:hypothetical protein